MRYRPDGEGYAKPEKYSRLRVVNAASDLPGPHVRYVRRVCDVRHRLEVRAPAESTVEGTVFEIVEARPLARGIKLFVIKAPRIARKQRPGQFVILRLDECGERIPLTIADADAQAGTVTIVVQAIGKTTMLLSMLEAGDSILDVVGPLGKPSEIEKFGTTVVVSGSVGTAMAYPTARELKRAGNKVISIVGARSKDLLVLEDEVRAVSDETYVVTDDGSSGQKGLVTDKLKELVAAGDVNYVLAVGPVPMMRAVANLTGPNKIKTIVSLNSIMVDGTGMCGGCRVLVNNSSQFACVDGPEFDATQVNFEVLMQRNNMYREQERASIDRLQADPEAELKRIRESNHAHACALEPVEVAND